MKYRIGSLDRRITFIKTDIKKENELGELENKDEVFDEVWAQVLEVKGSEQYKLEKVDANRDYEIIIRYRTDIDNTMEIDYEGRRLEILGPPTEIGRRRYLEIMAREKVTEYDRYRGKGS